MTRNPIQWILSALLVGMVMTGCSATAVPGDSEQDPNFFKQEESSDEQSPPASCLTPEDMERMSDQLFQLINLERYGVDLAPVRRSAPLNALAEDYACRMIQENFFAHHDPVTGSGPGARATRAGYRYYFIGENLAAGQPTAAEAMRDLMASVDHRDVILSSKWAEVGIGVRSGGEYGMYWVMEFADPVHSAVQVQPAGEPVAADFPDRVVASAP